MRRFLLGFVVAATLAAPVALIAAPTKVVNVTNPMSADLDGGGRSITNVGDLTVGGQTVLGSNVTIAEGVLSLGQNRPSILWGTENPASDPRAANAQPGSLFLEYAYQQESAWIEVGPDLGDWRQLAFAP